jgi:hypothetical protein
VVPVPVAVAESEDVWFKDPANAFGAPDSATDADADAGGSLRAEDAADSDFLSIVLK